MTDNNIYYSIFIFNTAEKWPLSIFIVIERTRGIIVKLLENMFVFSEIYIQTPQKQEKQSAIL